jgi:hypothetical protein
LLYTFRLRRDDLPLFAASALTHVYAFGAALFRQRRDASVRRGFVQRSVVLISARPYIGLLKAVAKLVGTAYLDAELDLKARTDRGEAADIRPEDHLRRAFGEIQLWPTPVAGTSLRLPLFGRCFDFDVPWTAVQGYKPTFSSDVHHDSIAPLSAEQEHVSATPAKGRRPLLQSGFPVPEAQVLFAEDLHTGTAAPTAPALTRPGAADLRLAVGPAGAPAASVRRSTRSGTGSSLGFHDVFARKRHRTPGLFQEIGLYSVFRGLCTHLWHLWELVITGQPVMIMAPSPERCGDAILALVSLIAPLEYCADYRPFFTLYDADFQQIVAYVDAQSGKSVASVRSPKPPLAQMLSSGRSTQGSSPGRSPHLTGASGRGGVAVGPGNVTRGGGGGGGAGGVASSGAAPASGSGSRSGSNPSSARASVSPPLRPVLSASMRPSPSPVHSPQVTDGAGSVPPLPPSAMGGAASGADRDLSSTGGSGALESARLRDSESTAGTSITPTASSRAFMATMNSSSSPAPALAAAAATSLGGGASAYAGSRASPTPALVAAAELHGCGEGGRVLKTGLPPLADAPSPVLLASAPRGGHSGLMRQASAGSAVAAGGAGGGMDRAALAALPATPLLIGTTNPFFSKALERWPNAVWLGPQTKAVSPRQVAAAASHAESFPTGAARSAGAGSGAAPGSRGAAGDPIAGASGAADGPAAAAAGSAPQSPSRRLQPQRAADGAGSGSGAARSVLGYFGWGSSGGGSAAGSGAAVSGSARGYSADEARDRMRVIPASASLADVLPAPGQEMRSEPAFVCRRQPLLSPDTAVLGQLLRVRPGDEVGKQLRITQGLSPHTSAAPSAATALPRASGGAVGGGSDGSGAHGVSGSSSGGAHGAGGVGASSAELLHRTLSRLSGGSFSSASGRLDAADGLDVEVADGEGESSRVHLTFRELLGGSEGAGSDAVFTVPADAGEGIGAGCTPGGGVSPGDRSVSAGASGGGFGASEGEIPAVVINNAVLRQHFRALTLAFLKPFERFFKPATHIPPAALAAGAAASACPHGRAPSAASFRSDASGPLSARLGGAGGGGSAAHALSSAGGSFSAGSHRRVGAGAPPPDDMLLSLQMAAGTSVQASPVEARGTLYATSAWELPAASSAAIAAATGLASGTSGSSSGGSGISSAQSSAGGGRWPVHASVGRTASSFDVDRSLAVSQHPPQPAAAAAAASTGTDAASDASPRADAATPRSDMGLSGSVVTVSSPTATGTTTAATETRSAPAAAGPRGVVRSAAAGASSSAVAAAGGGGIGWIGLHRSASAPTAGLSSMPHGDGGLAGHGLGGGSASASASCSVGGSGSGHFFGPYDDLTSLLLPSFEERAFLDALAAAGGPKHRLLKACRWRELYAGFIASPHFHPWFNARRRETARQFFGLSRALRLSVPLQELLRSIPQVMGASGSGSVGGGSGLPRHGLRRPSTGNGAVTGLAASTATSTTVAAALSGSEPTACAAGSRPATASTSSLAGAPLTTGAPSTDAAAPAPPPLPQPTLHRPLASFSADDMRRQAAACVDLHSKITAAFVREAHLLRDDGDLLAAMRGHLQAVEALMPAETRTVMHELARRSSPLVADDEA